MVNGKVTHNLTGKIKISSIIFLMLTIISTIVPVNASVQLFWTDYLAVYQESHSKGSYNVTIYYRTDIADPWYEENIIIKKTSRNPKLVFSETYPDNGVLEVYVFKEKGKLCLIVRYYINNPGLETAEVWLLKKM
jgi:hypothetical protein